MHEVGDAAKTGSNFSNTKDIKIMVLATSPFKGKTI